MFGFLTHYWLLTTAALAGLWVLSIHLLRHNSVGPLGRQLARREDGRVAEYVAAVADESAALEPVSNDATDEPAVP